MPRSRAKRESAMKTRRRVVATSVCLFWAIVSGRIAAVQLGSAEFRNAANSQRTATYPVEAAAGRILDRSGRILAITSHEPSLFADPSRIDDIALFANKVAPILGLPESQLADDLSRHSSVRFRWLARRVPPSAVDRIEELSLPDSSWGVRQERRRVYPQGPVAAHVIGLQDIDGHGRGGIEQHAHATMIGVDGTKRVVRDSLGRTVSLLSQVSTAPAAGRDVRLTIDAKLSTIVGRRLDECMQSRQPAWCAAIVLDPRDGEILSVESRPGYDPSSPVDIATGGFNYAFEATFEPGSTVKPLIVAAALESRVIGEDELIDCGPGRDVVAGRPMRDAVAWGRQPVANVLAKSSNIGSARIAERLGPEAVYRWYRSFGFAEPVSIQPPASAPGTLAPVDQWSGYSLGSLSIGHELAVTPLQLASAYITLISGRRIRPTVIRRGGHLIEQPPRLLGKSVCTWLCKVPLRRAVDSGTAKSVRIPGIEVFAKTGTAQKFDAELGKYRNDRATCVVVAGAPASEPTRLVVVVVDDPSIDPPFSGGRVAGPVARDILDSALLSAD